MGFEETKVIDNDETVRAETYIDSVRRRLSAYFDFEQVPCVFADAFQHWARFSQTDEKYFMTQKMNLYTVHTHRYVGLGCFDRVEIADIEKAFESLKRHMHERGSSPSTMSTDYTVALISRNAVEARAVRDCLSRMKCHMGFAWGFKGWADAGIVVVDLQERTVYANRFAEKQLQTVLWSFDDKPIVPPSRSIFARFGLIRCGCCTG